MKLYLAGPMRGYSQFNFPAFDSGAAQLRDAGYEVFSPADHDRTTYGDLTPENADDLGFNLRSALAADTGWICQHAEGIALLDGWHKSSGALAEVALGKALGIPVFEIAFWANPVFSQVP